MLSDWFCWLCIICHSLSSSLIHCYLPFSVTFYISVTFYSVFPCHILSHTVTFIFVESFTSNLFFFISVIFGLTIQYSLPHFSSFFKDISRLSFTLYHTLWYILSSFCQIHTHILSHLMSLSKTCSFHHILFHTGVTFCVFLLTFQSVFPVTFIISLQDNYYYFFSNHILSHPWVTFYHSFFQWNNLSIAIIALLLFFFWCVLSCSV